jgi:hypothetical protein
MIAERKKELTMTAYQLDRRTKGPMNEKEDWWHLIVDDASGEMRVEHEWDHLQINGLRSNSGTKAYSVEEFMDSDQPARVKDALTKRLSAIGAAP